MRLVVKEVALKNGAKTFQRIFGEGTMTYIHTRLHAYMSPYVPMDSGMMGQTVDITPEYVQYKQPYSHCQWDGKSFKSGKPLHYSKDQHPLASDHWEQAMWAAKKDEFLEEIQDYLRRK